MRLRTVTVMPLQKLEAMEAGVGVGTGARPEAGAWCMRRYIMMGCCIRVLGMGEEEEGGVWQHKAVRFDDAVISFSRHDLSEASCVQFTKMDLAP